MAIISDGTSVYVLGPDGKLVAMPPDRVSINGEDVFRFDKETGVLDMSADTQTIDVLVSSYEGYPIRELVVPGPGGIVTFCNVREIRPLPRADGSFFLVAQRVPVETAVVTEVRRSPTRQKNWLQRLLKL